MLRLLCPQWVFDNYEAVTPEFLKEHGVKLLLADLDFTLAPKSQSEPDESLTRWIGALKEAGIEFAILSNNRSPVRVEKFCKPLKVGYVGHAGKPGTRGFHEAMARYGVNAGERGTMCCTPCSSRSRPQARTTSGKSTEICKFHPQHQEKHLHCRTICGKIP